MSTRTTTTPAGTQVVLPPLVGDPDRDLVYVPGFSGMCATGYHMGRPKDGTSSDSTDRCQDCKSCPCHAEYADAYFRRSGAKGTVNAAGEFIRTQVVAPVQA